jgi:FKBP-type peptidyl-prolyl cis-trans isomerase
VVTQLSVGEKARCTIPADLAYGAKGFPGLIPVNTSLYVELELLSVTTPEME